MRVSTLDYQEVCKVYREAKSRKRELEEMAEEQVAAACIARAEKTLPLLYAEMVQAAKTEDPVAWAEAVASKSDEALSIPSMLCSAVKKFPGIFVCSKQVRTREEVPCYREHRCCYQEKMHIIDYVTDMYFCPLAPDVLICDVCHDTYEDFWYDLYDTHSLHLEGWNEFVASFWWC